MARPAEGYRSTYEEGKQKISDVARASYRHCAGRDARNRRIPQADNVMS